MKRQTSNRARTIVAIAAGVYVLAIVLVLGGFSFRSTSSASAQYEYGSKVTICHRTGSGKGVTLVVSGSAVDIYLARGDTIGPCP
jgi:hypothetical protein